MTDTKTPVKDVPTDLLADIPALLADLFMQRAGYSVRVIYLPDLKTPESAHIIILDTDNNPIDTLTNVPLDQALDIYRHPNRHSQALRDYINSGATPA